MDGKVGSERESRDRRDGWTPGPSLVLADGATWHLPAIDEGLFPTLGALLPFAVAVRCLGATRHRPRPAPRGLPDLMARYAVVALACQYRTERAELRELSRRAATVVKFADPDKGLVLARHLVEVAKYAVRRRLVGFEGEPIRAWLN